MVCKGNAQGDACGERSYGGPTLQHGCKLTGLMVQETWLKNQNLTRQGDTQELYTGAGGGDYTWLGVKPSNMTVMYMDAWH